MATGLYYAVGAAMGLVEGWVYAIDELVPGGDAAIRSLGLERLLPPKQHLAQNGGRRDGPGGADALIGAHEAGGDQQLHGQAHGKLAKLNSFPVDDVGEDLEEPDAAAGGEAGGGAPDAPAPEAPPPRSPLPPPPQQLTASPSPRRRGVRGGGGGGGGAGEAAGAGEGAGASPSAALRVPKLKLPGVAEGRADAAAPEDVILPGPADILMGPPAASRLTEQNVGPFNAAFDAERAGRRGGGGGGGEEDHDIITIATTNRYTYGLGPLQAGASTPATPRSEAASEGFLGGGAGGPQKQKKRFGLFRALRCSKGSQQQ